MTSSFSDWVKSFVENCIDVKRVILILIESIETTFMTITTFRFLHFDDDYSIDRIRNSNAVRIETLSQFNLPRDHPTFPTTETVLELLENNCNYVINEQKHIYLFESSLRSDARF